MHRFEGKTLCASPDHDKGENDQADVMAEPNLLPLQRQANRDQHRAFCVPEYCTALLL